METFQLRISNVLTLHNAKKFGDGQLLQLPIIASGSLVDLREMCTKANLEFVADDSLFGGYYRSSAGDCYYFT